MKGIRILRGLLRGFAFTLLGVLVIVAALWTFGALWFASVPARWLRIALAVLFAAGVVTCLARRRKKLALALVAGVFALVLARFLSLEPKLEGDWHPNEARLPWAEIDGDRVTVHEVRNTVYRSDLDFDPRWDTRTYDLSTLESVWFAMVPFQDFAPGAHTFVSFGFADGRYLAISIEARKEVGEEYGMLPGLFRRFELFYLIADERDLVGVRSHIRGDTVFLYPAATTPEGRRAFLLELLGKATALHEKPEFYNTITSTCTLALRDHLNRVLPAPLPWDPGMMFPGYSDRYALRQGLIATDLPLDAARERYRVDPVAAPLDAPDFSAAIRSRGQT